MSDIHRCMKRHEEQGQHARISARQTRNGLRRNRVKPYTALLLPGLADPDDTQRHNRTLRKALTDYSVQRAMQREIVSLHDPSGWRYQAVFGTSIDRLSW